MSRHHSELKKKDSSPLVQIEENIKQLSLSEQLWLIERIAHHIREKTSRKKDNLEDQIAEMAADPQIQNELRRINEEFAITEEDGLENH